MARRENSTHPIHSTPLSKRILVGAGIGFMLIAFFLLGAGEPNPAWPKFWMVKPLLMVPFAGALGGVFYHFMDHLRYGGGWRKVLANILSVLVFITALWLGVVLGLNGTMWD